MNRKVLVYIAASVDGYIAGQNEDLTFLSMVEKPGEDYGYSQFISTIDTVIQGRKTYDWVMKHVPEFSHSDKETYVITKTPRPAFGKTIFYSGNLVELVQQLKTMNGKDIFVDGGSETIHSLLQNKLVDEIIISYIPILLGDGTRLFREGRIQQSLQLVSSRQFDTGLLQVHFKCLL